MTCSYSKEFSSKGYTDLENSFITEYLPLSDGNAVKVYLYGLFLCQNPECDKSVSEIAEKLKLTDQQVIDSFSFWEEFGLVNVLSKEPLSVVYLPVKSGSFSKPRKYKAEKYTEFSKSLQAIIPDRMISVGEYTDYYNIMETYDIKPEAMLLIVKSCVDRKGNSISYKYISTVAKNYGQKGINTVEKVEKELQSYILKTGEIQKILKALSLKRIPEIEDLNFYKKWTEELTFETDNIVFAASKIKKGSMEKLDEFLLQLYSTKSFTKAEIADYMAKKQHVYELAVKINRSLSVYMEVIDTVVDTFTNKWLTYGFTDEALLYIANYCFKIGQNTLQNMDDLIESLYKKGIIDLSSVSDYFEGIKTQDEFIKKMLLTAGVNRRPNDWDRNNLSTWKSWNFDEDMILEAAKLASGKASPIPYINGILSNWKNNNVFTLKDVSNNTEISRPLDTKNSIEAYNIEYEKRRTAATLLAAKNMQTAMELSGFAEEYANLNDIEKEIAFAEVAENAEAIKTHKQTKKEILKKLSDILSVKNLTLDDLKPNYACKKCNDTGYVGTQKCDCFDKKI